MVIWHLTWSTCGRVLAFPTERDRRAAVRSIVRVSRGMLLMF